MNESPPLLHLVPIIVSLSAIMPGCHFSKKHNKSNVVMDRMHDRFNQHCLDALAKQKLKPTTTKINILGTAVLEEPTSVPMHLAKIRSFVHFLLVNPQCDDSLPVFCPCTPAGTVTVQQSAVCHFLISKFRMAREPLVDFQVSRHARVCRVTLCHLCLFLSCSDLL